jgi:hypothetical protein
MKNLMFDVDSFLNEVDVSELENATTEKNVQRNRFNSSSPRSPNEFDSLILEEFLSGNNNTKETSPNKTIPKESPRNKVTTLNISNINKFSASEGSPRSLSPNNNSPNSNNKSFSEGSPRALQSNNNSNSNNSNNKSPREIESPRYSMNSNDQFKLATSVTANRRGTGANANSLSPRDRRASPNPSSEFATTRDRAREREARANNSNIIITEPSLIGLNRSDSGNEGDKQNEQNTRNKPPVQLRRVSQQVYITSLIYY